MLGIPRPRTRGDCQGEARPCPWVGCRHHNLLDVGTGSKRQGVSIARERGPGRRPHLGRSCGDDELRRWTDAAVSTVYTSTMSCSLDAGDLGPHTQAETAAHLKLSEAQVGVEYNNGLRKLFVRVGRASGYEIDEDNLPPVKQLAAWLRAVVEHDPSARNH